MHFPTFFFCLKFVFGIFFVPHTLLRPQIPHGVGFFTVRFKLRFDGLWEHGYPKLGHLYGTNGCFVMFIYFDVYEPSASYR